MPKSIFVFVGLVTFFFSMEEDIAFSSTEILFRGLDGSETWVAGRKISFPGRSHIEIQELDSPLAFRMDLMLHLPFSNEVVALSSHILHLEGHADRHRNILLRAAVSELDRWSHRLSSAGLIDRARRLAIWTDELLKYAHSPQGEPLPGRIRLALLWKKEAKGLISPLLRLQPLAALRWRTHLRILALQKTILSQSAFFVSKPAPLWTKAEDTLTPEAYGLSSFVEGLTEPDQLNFRVYLRSLSHHGIYPVGQKVISGGTTVSTGRHHLLITGETPSLEALLVWLDAIEKETLLKKCDSAFEVVPNSAQTP